jgi:hypothetical protein
LPWPHHGQVLIGTFLAIIAGQNILNGIAVTVAKILVVLKFSELCAIVTPFAIGHKIRIVVRIISRIVKDYRNWISAIPNLKICPDRMVISNKRS